MDDVEQVEQWAKDGTLERIAAQLTGPLDLGDGRSISPDNLPDKPLTWCVLAGHDPVSRPGALLDLGRLVRALRPLVEAV